MTMIEGDPGSINDGRMTDITLGAFVVVKVTEEEVHDQSIPVGEDNIIFAGDSSPACTLIAMGAALSEREKGNHIIFVFNPDEEVIYPGETGERTVTEGGEE